MNKRNFFQPGEIYHVFNKSIANFNIFRKRENYERFIQALAYYNNVNTKTNLGKFLESNKNYQPSLLFSSKEAYIKFIGFCLMPDHYHLLIKILKNNIFSKYISDVENSYTRYFNLRFNRKGPLWQSRVKAVKIRSNEQLLHVSRYIHLNPTTNNLVKRPEDWEFSSYRTIIKNEVFLKDIFAEISISNINKYQKFVENQIDYQKKLKRIKKLIFD
ncbi:MAG: transposase [Patescibacteria group bacterium]|nr:transposase [Patescibacteria group bacterium]